MDSISNRDRQLKDPKSSRQYRNNNSAGNHASTNANRRGVLQARWEEMLSRLVAYKNRFGHCLVPNRYSEDPALGAWVSTQRRQYKILISGCATSTPMTPERAAKLEAIGFKWKARDPRHVSWDKRFEQLVAFKEKYGNCLVPIKYRGNPQLSNWVSTQRQELKLLLKGCASRMTIKKICLLNIIGFTWEAQRGGGRWKLKRIADEAGRPFPATNRTPRHVDDDEMEEPVAVVAGNQQLPPRQLLLSAAAVAAAEVDDDDEEEEEVVVEEEEEDEDEEEESVDEPSPSPSFVDVNATSGAVLNPVPPYHHYEYLQASQPSQAMPENVHAGTGTRFFSNAAGIGGGCGWPAGLPFNSNSAAYYSAGGFEVSPTPQQGPRQGGVVVTVAGSAPLPTTAVHYHPTTMPTLMRAPAAVSVPAPVPVPVPVPIIPFGNFLPPPQQQQAPVMQEQQQPTYLTPTPASVFLQRPLLSSSQHQNHLFHHNHHHHFHHYLNDVNNLDSHQGRYSYGHVNPAVNYGIPSHLSPPKRSEESPPPPPSPATCLPMSQPTLFAQASHFENHGRMATQQQQAIVFSGTNQNQEEAHQGYDYNSGVSIVVPHSSSQTFTQRHQQSSLPLFSSPPNNNNSSKSSNNKNNRFAQKEATKDASIPQGDLSKIRMPLSVLPKPSLSQKTWTNESKIKSDKNNKKARNEIDIVGKKKNNQVIKSIKQPRVVMKKKTITDTGTMPSKRSNIPHDDDEGVVAVDTLGGVFDDAEEDHNDGWL